MAKGEKTAIEDAVIDYIKATMTATGASLDTDLPTQCRFTIVDRAEGLLVEDYQRGPAVRVWNTGDQVIDYETGNGLIKAFFIRLTGCNAASSSGPTANLESDLIKTILEYKMMNFAGYVGAISTGLTGNKQLIPGFVKVIGTNWSDSTGASGVTDPRYVTIFTMTVQLIAELVI